MHIGDLPNRNPIESLRAQHRLDPYWGGLWDNGAGAAWFTRGQAARDGAGAAWLDGDDPDDNLRKVLRGKFAKLRSREVAAVNQWRTMTVQQLAAITGAENLRLLHRSGDLRQLFSAGLVDIGRPASFSRTMPMLVRTSSSGSWGRLWEHASFDEWVGITAGQNWRWGSQHERHNIVTVEAALRAAELLDVSAVLGEQLCALNTVCPPGWSAQDRFANLGADAMLVRPDGLRIMVETTANTNGIDKKMQRWADVLLADRTGSMVVCFLHAPHPDAAGGRARLDQIRDAVRRAGSATIEHVRAGVASRMCVASWQDWFPAMHEVSPDFLGLRAYRATGRVERQFWQPVDLIERFDVPTPDPSAGVDALLVEKDLLLGIPHWMRTEGVPSATDRYLSGVGYEDLPVIG